MATMRRELYYCFVFISVFQWLVLLIIVFQMQVYDSGCLTDTGLTPVPQMVDECRTDNGAVVYISFSDTDSPGDDIAYMPNPSVDDLMKICSSLKHCTGFSSSGWIKSDTAQRRPLVGSSLYVKRPFERPCLITKPSPVSAAYNHHQHAQYLEMTNHIRMYPLILICICSVHCSTVLHSSLP
jgi:hypothetical protein